MNQLTRYGLRVLGLADERCPILLLSYSGDPWYRNEDRVEELERRWLTDIGNERVRVACVGLSPTLCRT